jgi:hypothetical protein
MIQLNLVDDFRGYAKSLGEFWARPIGAGQRSTLYSHHSQGAMIKGIREKDYLSSPCKNWMELHNQMESFHFWPDGVINSKLPG